MSIKQPDLFEHAPLSVKLPAGMKQPVLWVRRLTIWKEPGVAVRTVDLRPGLNFVWSPDPADFGGSSDAGELGHGAGKTLFCRLLRYCLGEDRFAPEDQRLSITTLFLNGWVSAEVMLHRKLWGVLRPLAPGRGHFAVEGVLPEQLFERLGEPTGMAPLMAAIENDILTAKVAALMPVDHKHDAWRVTLAWLTRDQECRFDHVLDWRAAESDSESPTRSMSRSRLQEALRVLIAAISPEEIELHSSVATQLDAHRAKTQEIDRRQWAVEQLRLQLVRSTALAAADVPEGRLCLDVLRQAASQQLARASKVSAAVDVSNLDGLRQRWRDADQRVTELEKQQAVLQASLPLHESLLKQLRAELPAGAVQAPESAVPACQICDVPLDQVLLQGCRLSNQTTDIKLLRQKQDAQAKNLAKQVAEKQAEIDELTLKIATLKRQLPTARIDRDSLRQALSQTEQQNDSRSSAWFQATKNVDDIARLTREWDDWETAQADAAQLVAQMDEKRERMGAFRDRQAVVFDRLSACFDTVIRTVVGPVASGRVRLDGNGVKLAVQLGGERSTAAIESLKVIAFDLAVMCLSMEGNTYMPAFLVHDSPREADLGLSVYHRIFDMVATLEGPQEQSAFQYIVTTTTQPPLAFQQAPWLCLELRGSPSNERLLRCDLP